MNRFDKVIFGQKAFIINKKREILILKRKTTEVYQNLWDIPGGKKEKDDTLLEALERELYEETGMKLDKVILTLTSSVFEGSAEDKPLISRNIYLCIASGEVKLSEEHSEYKWIDPRDILNYDFPKNIDFEVAINKMIKLFKTLPLNESLSEVI